MSYSINELAKAFEQGASNELETDNSTLFKDVISNTYTDNRAAHKRAINTEEGKNYYDSNMLPVKDSFVNGAVDWTGTNLVNKGLLSVPMSMLSLYSLAYPNQAQAVKILPFIKGGADIGLNTMVSALKYNNKGEEPYGIEKAIKDIAANSGALAIDNITGLPGVAKYLASKGVSKLATELGSSGLKYLTSRAFAKEEDSINEIAKQEGISREEAKALLELSQTGWKNDNTRYVDLNTDNEYKHISDKQKYAYK